MAQPLVVPALGESVSEATVLKWLKKAGDSVKRDEALVELETDKVTVEVNAPFDGVLTEIAAQEGATVEVGKILAQISEGGGVVSAKATAAPMSPPTTVIANDQTAAKENAAPQVADKNAHQQNVKQGEAAQSGPAARKLMDEKNLTPNDVQGTGKDGRVTKEDVQNYQPASASPASSVQRPVSEREERVKMTRLRQVVAKRLKDAQNTAAMLTTFNEVDMSAVMQLRKSYADKFADAHGIKLGFMSFFVKAAIKALKEFPAVNAEIAGDEIIYKNHYDISVAVSTPTGLIVPVIRDADQLSFAGIESKIVDLGTRAKAGKITMDEMQGGTFTITNGGTFGSLLSTPILNAPQTGILGMHKIEERPIALNGQVVIRPMMYLALSYDHRLIDGREAVSFLVRIKDMLEDPQRLLLEI